MHFGGGNKWIALIFFFVLVIALFKTKKDKDEAFTLITPSQPANCFSDIKCDDTGMSCLITNLIIDSQGRFVLKVEKSRTDLLNLAGFFGHFGIGEPAAYFYIDSWTLIGKKAFRHAAIRQGYRRVDMEKRLFPSTPFVPIFLTYSHGNLCEENVFERIHQPTLFIQVLWRSNFFRKLYISAVALSTCQYWLGCSSCKNAMFVQHLEEAVNLFDRNPISRLANKVFDFAIVGMSKRFVLPEQDILMIDNRNLALMISGYKAFVDAVQKDSKCNRNYPKRLFVYRRGNARRVLNHQEICQRFNLTPIIFEDYKFEEQLCLASKADLIVGAHGAAMAHAFFMNKNALLIELFPCNFIKTIYRNLALVQGVKYRWWQAGDPDCCPSLPKGQVDWSSLASKDLFRNQNFYVDLKELASIVQFDVEAAKYLVYMPFEQYNNQLISLRCACGMARLLNRTLVLPQIGYKLAASSYSSSLRSNQRQVYQPRDYLWQPLSRYFNVSRLQEHLPCQTVPYSAYYGQVKSIDRIYFRRLGARFNKKVQPESYFYFVAGLHYSHHRSLPYSIPVYNSATSVLKYFSDYARSLKHLAVGNVFWMYTFDARLEYPVKRYVDVYEEGLDSSYKNITFALDFTDRLYRLYSQLHSTNHHRYVGAVHWRRGDYKEKCQEELLPHSCYPTIRNLANKISEIDPMRTLTWKILSNQQNTFSILHRLTKRGFKVHAVECPLDPIECAILDQIAAIEAMVFIGNMYSSFTRTIIDKRNQRGRKSELL